MNHRNASKEFQLMGVKMSISSLPNAHDGYDCPGRKGWLSTLGGLIAAGVLLTISMPGFANPDVLVIDRWNIDHGVSTTTEESVAVDDDSVENLNIIGGWRKVRVDRIAGGSGRPASSFVDVDDRTVSHDNASGVTSILEITWDGTEDLAALSFELEASLALTCPVSAQEPGITFVATVFANESNVELRVYTNEDSFSVVGRTLSQLPGNLPQVVFIPLSEITDPQNVTEVDDGFTLNDIGAIRFVSTVTEPSADFILETPVVLGCGTDFGDAPQEGAEPEGEDHTGLTYPVTLGGSGTGNAGVHFIGGPFLGLGNNDTDSEPDGQPTLEADGDDLTDVNDEQALVGGFQPRPIPVGLEPEGPMTCDGVEMASVVEEFTTTEANDLYCVTLEVANPTDRSANVIGWIDFAGNGLWNNGGCGQSADGLVTSDCERSSATVFRGSLWENAVGDDPDGESWVCSEDDLGLGDPIGGSSWSTGNVPAGCQGQVVLVWDLSNFRNDQGHFTQNDSYARFRISTDTDTFLTANGATPCCTAIDGEVEDHIIASGILPVTVSFFESRWTNQGLELIWETSSETENLGFYIWGYSDEELHLLTPEIIPSEAFDALEPQRYSMVISDPRARSMDSLAIAAVDIFGDEEIYGLYQVEGAFGREDTPAPIDWASIRSEVSEALDLHARLGPRATLEQGPVTGADFRVTQPGMQRVTYEQLTEAGMGFGGINPADLAVTRAGEPVARFVRLKGAVGGSRASTAASNTFGPGSYIEFWGEMPDFPNALYVENYVYRVTAEPSKAVDGRLMAQRVSAGSPLSHHLGSFRVNEDNGYVRSVALPDPWVAAMLNTLSESNRSYQTDVQVGPKFRAGSPGRLEVVVAGGVSHPVSPAHHVRVYFNDVAVYEAKFDARERYDIKAEVPAELIQDGVNHVRVFLPGGTAAPNDQVYVDTIELFYPREFTLREGGLLIQESEPGARVQVSDVPVGASASVFAWDGAELLQLRSRVRSGSDVAFQTLADGSVQYWVSTSESVQSAEFVRAVHSSDLLDEPAEFLIIAHPAFMPLSEFDVHPLNDFVNQRRSEGWSVRVVDVTEIQRQFGGGMPLPQAVTDFLRAAADTFAPSHVLLVGGDSADYHDRRGVGSLSFIPTIYAPTARTPHTPADGLLADLNGNRVADLAIGRWPVRTMGDLESIVTKTLDWSATVSDLRSAVWIADSNDSRHPSFSGMAGRMLEQLNLAGWPQASLNSISLDQVDDVTSARHQLFDEIEAGATFTGFVGHGTMTGWTFQSLLRPNDLAELRNEGSPTLIATSSCDATYFVSPTRDTVAHRWMNGFRLDGNGDPISGAANGAVAVHGASTHAGAGQNEFMVSQTKAGMLESETLGEAVRQAREAAAARGMWDQVTNWVLLGDPTLRLR